MCYTIYRDKGEGKNESQAKIPDLDTILKQSMDNYNSSTNQILMTDFNSFDRDHYKTKSAVIVRYSEIKV